MRGERTDRLHISLSDRFWVNVDIKDKNECWNWKKSTVKGYGQIRMSNPRRMELAHRISYILTYGEIPNGKLVLHKCDNKICVNPNHLYLGDASDNMKDCIKRDGWVSPRKRFYDNDIEKMCLLEKNGLTYTEVSNIFYCSEKHVRRLIRKRRLANA